MRKDCLSIKLELLQFCIVNEQNNQIPNEIKKDMK